MFFTVHIRHLFCILCLTILLISGIILIANRTLVPVFSIKENDTAEPLYIVDAGHGGEDGGAVSAAGAIESHINLAISQRLAALLCFLGEETVMTREDEHALYSADAVTLREKKRSDLNNRVQFINEQEHAILVSIHQNSMPTAPSVHGAQVFYNTAESADALAIRVQSSLNQSLNRENEKESKPIDPSIYLMKYAACPAILVECGFLSNASEAEALQDANYQTKVAAAIAAGLLDAKTEMRHSNEGK